MEDKWTPMSMSYLSQSHLTLELIWDNKHELYSLTCYQPVFIRDGTLSSTLSCYQEQYIVFHPCPTMGVWRNRMFQAVSECIPYPAIGGPVLEWNGWRWMGPQIHWTEASHLHQSSPRLLIITGLKCVGDELGRISLSTTTTITN